MVEKVGFLADTSRIFTAFATVTPWPHPMFGHSALRAHVMGLERSLTVQPTKFELKLMQRIATDALYAGFIGISIDMFPWHRMSGEWQGCTIPSQHAKFKEYAMLADLCRRSQCVFQVTPNLQRLASFVDILRMGSGIGQKPLRLTVLSALDAVHDRKLWRIFSPLLFIWNRLLNGNVRFQTLTEPFTIYSDGSVTPLFEQFSTGAQLNGCQSREERQQLWASEIFRRQFRQEWLSKRRKSFHRRLDLMEVIHCPEASWQGLSFAQIAGSLDLISNQADMILKVKLFEPLDLLARLKSPNTCGLIRITRTRSLLICRYQVSKIL